MLWYKAWLETRWRMLLPAGMIFFALFTGHQSKGRLHFGPGSMLGVVGLFWLTAPLTLAGSGLRTEAPFQAVKGLHGSTYFTLSLPVSRLRLFASRTALGILETAGILVAVCGIAVAVFPELRGLATAADGFRYMATLLLCSLGYFGFSTLLSTFVDQQWQVLIAVGTIFLSLWLGVSGRLPRSLDMFAAMGPASPLINHAMPWGAVALSVGAGIVFLLAALRVVQAREY